MPLCSAENLQTGAKQVAFPCALSFSVVYAIGKAAQKSHENIFGSTAQDFYIWKWDCKNGKQSF